MADPPVLAPVIAMRSILLLTLLAAPLVLAAPSASAETCVPYFIGGQSATIPGVGTSPVPVSPVTTPPVGSGPVTVGGGETPRQDVPPAHVDPVPIPSFTVPATGIDPVTTPGATVPGEHVNGLTVVAPHLADGQVCNPVSPPGPVHHPDLKDIKDLPGNLPPLVDNVLQAIEEVIPTDVGPISTLE
jgi:hypothetical protein